jgi:hypothetical protein
MSRVAILIGWDEYEYLPKLRAPRKDIVLMRTMLKSDEIGGFDEVRIFDKGESVEKILGPTETLITETVKADDFLLIYFSGHGKLDQLGNLYLALKKTLDATSIAAERVYNYIERSRCRSVVMILDCCFSGAIGGVTQKGEFADALGARASGRGFTILTSSTKFQESVERDSDEHSLFTKMFIEGINSGYADSDNDGVITVDEAYTYAYNAVKATGLQIPTKYNLDAHGDLVLARNQHFVVPDPASIPSEKLPKFVLIDLICRSMRSRDPKGYYIGLSGYWIEGIPYSAGGLSVDIGATPNMRLMQDGFETDAYFEPNMIQPTTLHGREIIPQRFGDGTSRDVVKVRLTVKFDDIWAIVAFPGGVQTDLYRNTSDFLSSKARFWQEFTEYFRKVNA